MKKIGPRFFFTLEAFHEPGYKSVRAFFLKINSQKFLEDWWKFRFSELNELTLFYVDYKT